jgi:hypothetical protein
MKHVLRAQLQHKKSFLVLLLAGSNHSFLPQFSCQPRGCIQKFPDWVDNEIYAYLWYYSLRSNTKGYDVKTH